MLALLVVCWRTFAMVMMVGYLTDHSAFFLPFLRSCSCTGTDHHLPLDYHTTITIATAV